MMIHTTIIKDDPRLEVISVSPDIQIISVTDIGFGELEVKYTNKQAGL